MCACFCLLARASREVGCSGTEARWLLNLSAPRSRAAPKHSDFGQLASQMPELRSLNGIPAADPDNLVHHLYMSTPGLEIALRWMEGPLPAPRYSVSGNKARRTPGLSQTLPNLFMASEALISYPLAMIGKTGHLQFQVPALEVRPMETGGPSSTA